MQSQLHTKTKALTRLQLVTENQMNIRDFFHVRRQTLVSQILLLTWKFQVIPLHQVLPTQPVLMKLMSSITCFEAATEWKMEDVQVKAYLEKGMGEEISESLVQIPCFVGHVRSGEVLQLDQEVLGQPDECLIETMLLNF